MWYVILATLVMKKRQNLEVSTLHKFHSLSLYFPTLHVVDIWRLSCQDVAKDPFGAILMPKFETLPWFQQWLRFFFQNIKVLIFWFLKGLRNFCRTNFTSFENQATKILRDFCYKFWQKIGNLRNFHFILVSMFNVWNKDFLLGQLFLWKSRRIAQSKQIQKSAMGLGVTVTYAHSVGFVL